MKKYKNLFLLTLVTVLAGCTNSKWTKMTLQEFGPRTLKITEKMEQKCDTVKAFYRYTIDEMGSTADEVGGDVQFDMPNLKIWEHQKAVYNGDPGIILESDTWYYYNPDKGIVCASTYFDTHNVEHKYTLVVVKNSEFKDLTHNNIAKAMVNRYEECELKCFTGCLSINAAGSESNIAKNLIETRTNPKLIKSYFGYINGDEGSAKYDITAEDDSIDDTITIRMAAEIENYCCTSFVYENKTTPPDISRRMTSLTFSAKKIDKPVNIEIPDTTGWDTLGL